MKQTETPPKSPHMSAGVGISKGFWLPACIRLLFLACQMPVMGTVCECHFEAHNQNKTYYSLSLELPNTFLYLFHEKSAKKKPDGSCVQEHTAVIYGKRFICLKFASE